MKKNILFIADKPNWAYHFIIKTWAELLPEYNCYIAFAEDYFIRPKDFSFLDLIKNQLSQLKNTEVKYKINSTRKYSYRIYKGNPVYEVLTNKRVNLTHFDTIVEMAYYFQYISEFPFKAEKRIVGLYTDSFPHDGPGYDAKKNIDVKKLNRKEFFEQYLKSYDFIIAGCNNIVKSYQSLTSKIKFAYGIYKQNEFGKNKKEHDEFTIGWTGTPDRPMKGFRNIIEPAIAEVNKTGRNIKLKVKSSGSYEELFDFYNDIDLVLIASVADSGPSLFAEASLSNIPCLSTAVGLPEMVIQDGINGRIIKRDIEAFKNAIIDVYDDREKLHSWSKRIKNDYLKIMDNAVTIEHIKQLLD